MISFKSYMLSLTKSGKVVEGRQLLYALMSIVESLLGSLCHACIDITCRERYLQSEQDSLWCRR